MTIIEGQKEGEATKEYCPLEQSYALVLKKLAIATRALAKIALIPSDLAESNKETAPEVAIDAMQRMCEIGREA